MRRRYDPRSTEAEEYRRWYRWARWKGTNGRRLTQLRAEPLCEFCLAVGRITAATVADHVTPHRGDPVEFWFGQLQSLCADCHDTAKSQIESRGFHSATDADGYPVDPNHPANRPR